MNDEAFMSLDQPIAPGAFRYLTQFREGDAYLGGFVTAYTWEGAEVICALRGYGEVVVGRVA